MKIKVLCKIVEHGNAYGKTGQVIEVPDHIARELVKSKRAEEVKAKESANSESK